MDRLNGRARGPPGLPHAAAADGNTPLLMASQRGHEAVAAMLLDAGASVHAASKDNFTVLMAASLGGLDSLVTRLLPLSQIDAAVVASHPTQAGCTALTYAKQQGHAKVVALLEAHK